LKFARSAPFPGVAHFNNGQQANNMNIKLPLLALCLHTTLTQVIAQTLWEGMTYGMSLNEVKTAVPNAVDVTSPSSLANGFTERLQVEDWLAAERRFKVGLFFRGDQLAQVMLRLKVTERDTFEKCLSVFEALSTTCRDKYGEEVSKKKNDDGPGYRRYFTEWSSGSTRISILLVDVKGRYSINVNYQVSAK
jgi:hypothetical protein